MIKIKIK